jgi:type II secretory ATPase GspE/PulE/Tfp pilus assembly ATPase PilB-like protein
MAQRLIRIVCPHCREQYHITKDECFLLKIDYDKVKNYKLSIGRGCPECRGTGYRGRTSIFEIMELTSKLKEDIHENATPLKIKKGAQGQGMNTLRENAIKRLLQGITTVDEIIRVIGLSA